MDIDPYKMLGLQKIFTPDQLRLAYKKAALAMHPDKQGGNDYMFKMLITCYKQLVKDYNRRVSDKQFNELKQESKAYTAPLPLASASAMQEAKKSFNINKFNNIFDENKLPDAVRDTGYNDWLRQQTDDIQPKLKGKFTNTAFNEQFNNQTSQPQSKHLIKYKEPEAMLTCKKIQFTEIGDDNTEDFSADNLSKKNLNYMDLKIAHLTSRLVDPKTVDNRKTYNTVGDVEADRANISYSMSDKEMREYQKRKQLEELKEKQRVQNALMKDHLAQQQFDKVNRLMLGGR